MLHAQERPAGPGIEHRISPTVLQSPVGSPVRYPKQRLDPVRREQMQLRRYIGEREAESVLLRRDKKAERDLARETGLWKATIGNTYMNNRSPYPDRYLDARTIKYPLPKKTPARHR